MDRTVPPEVTVAEDAGAAADVADKVLRPDNSRRYKAHSQGRKTHKMPELHRRLPCNPKVQAYNSRDHNTQVRLHNAASITVASTGASMVVPGSRSTEDIVVRTKKDRVHLVLLDQ